MYDTPAHVLCTVNEERYESFREKLEKLTAIDQQIFNATSARDSQYLMCTQRDSPAYFGVRAAVLEAANRNDPRVEKR